MSVDHVGVAGVGRGLRLAQESLGVLIVGGEVGAQDAHDDIARKLVVERS